MKFPIVSLEDTNARLDRAEAAVVEIQESLHRIEGLIEKLILLETQLAGLEPTLDSLIK